MTPVGRRTFLGGCAAMLAAPLAARAQQSPTVPHVGYLFSFTPEQGQHLWRACRQGLQELGYVVGKNIVLEPRWADGHHDRLGSLVADLVRLKVDVIVAAATPANLAAKKGAGTIPIVMVAVAEPVKVGLVASLAQPGGNVTGLTLLTPELSGKRVQLLADALGKLGKVAILMNPANRSHDVFFEETLVACRQLGCEIHPLKARGPEEIEQAFRDVAALHATGLIVFDDPVIWSHRAQVVRLAAKGRLPVMYGYREFVDDGGLMSYGPYRPDLYRRTAIYVDKILKGSKPADLPVEQPTKFEFIVNVKTAKALGLTIPPELLLRADQVIE